MTNEIYEKAKQLKEDIKSINRQVNEVEKEHHWITTSTPNCNNDGASSLRFQKELVDWLKQTMERYQKEFDELICI